jgi:bifunctional non-homologous end joining protein LigD
MMSDEPAAAAHALARELERLGAPRARVRPESVRPMLAETREKPFTEKGWLFELKYDGFRVLAARDGDEACLFYRRGNDSTAVFPEVARALAALPFPSLVLDGEVVCLDDEGRPSFQRLQKRALLQRASDVARAAVDLPATLCVFDFLAFEDFDLRPLPLVDRKRLLRRVLPGAGPLRIVDHVEEQGEAFYAEVSRLRLEGIVAKRAAAPYRGGRFADWLKLRVDRTADFVVVGFTEPGGERSGFGALHLADYVADELVYAGRAGSGFDEHELTGTRARLEATRVSPAPCGGPLPRGREHVWVRPELVCEVRYKEWTEDHLLRQPVFVRFRPDKAPAECRREERRAREAPPSPASVSASPRGHTRDDVVEFYREMAPWLLAYLRDRPIVLDPGPRGGAGASAGATDGPSSSVRVRRERVFSEHARHDVDCFVAADVESLLSIVAASATTLPVWASRISDGAHPDWCRLDLDPGGVRFALVARVARELRALADEMAVPCFVKTSGSAGLEVLLALGGLCTFEQTTSLAELVARVAAARLPEIATTARDAPGRGRVRIDFLQNGQGRALAAPYSVGPGRGGIVSTPLAWDEVDDGLDAGGFTIRTVPQRMRTRGDDPLAGVLTARPDLERALARLAELMG